ncbi:MAG: DUF4185 domain-containing protein [Sphingobacteriaceae bacterium]|nr:MAG: DUF4185 domain-containing protein [Sphingobacteriaceae bacterium]
MQITIKPVFILIFWLTFGGSTLAQQKADLEHIRFSIQRADDWTALFNRNSGWFGGDGIYTIPLSGNEHKLAGKNSTTLFIFSDSMIGQTTDSTMLPGYKMIHNAVAYLSGYQPDKLKMKFYWQQNKTSSPESVFSPHTSKTNPADYFWLGDGFVNQALNKAIYIFGYRVRNFSSDAFGFKEVGNVIIKIPKNNSFPYTDQKQLETPFYADSAGTITSFGAGIFVNTADAGANNPDGYIYVYGVKGLAKELLVARVQPKDFEDFAKWRFWTGTSWSAQMNESKAVTNSVSNELSLTRLPDGRYALIFQVGGMTTSVGMRLGASPFGPFGPIIKLWDCSADLKKKTYVVYNAKAHPTLSKSGELLISYNINSTEFIKDLSTDPHLYRPRFIRVKFK